MKTGKLYGVGIGPGDPQYLTLRAADVLRSVDVVFTVISPNASNSVSQSVVDYLQPRGEVRLQVFSMSRDKTIREEQVRANAEAIIAELRAGHDCAFATLGDAMTYSTFGYVLEIIRKAIPNLDLEVIPGITSFATLTAKAGTVLVENGEQLRIIPSFRAEMAEALDFPKGSTTILLKSYRSRGALLDRLAREEKVQVLYGEHLAMKEQALLTDPDAIRARPEKYLSLIMVVHPAYARGLAPDEGRTHNRHADSGRFPGKGHPRRRPPHTGEWTTFRRGKDLHEAGDLRTAVRHRGHCGLLWRANGGPPVAYGAGAADGAPDPHGTPPGNRGPCHAYRALFQRRCRQHSGKQPC